MANIYYLQILVFILGIVFSFINRKIRDRIMILFFILFFINLIPGCLHFKSPAFQIDTLVPIKKIILTPLYKDYPEMELFKKEVIIEDSFEINKIINFLQTTIRTNSSRPMENWRTKLVLINTKKDSVSFEILNSKNNGLIITNIEKENLDYRNDSLGNYLEVLANQNAQQIPSEN